MTRASPWFSNHPAHATEFACPCFWNLIVLPNQFDDSAANSEWNKAHPNNARHFIHSDKSEYPYFERIIENYLTA